MLKVSSVFCVVFMSLTLSLCAFAEDAPVYDAGSNDSYPPAFDNSSSDAAADVASPVAMAADPAIPEPGEDVNDVKAPPPPTAANPSLSPSLSIEQHIDLLEQKINNLQHDNTLSKFESLQAEVQSLRDQVEELNHLLTQIKEQQKSMYSDLDARLTQLKANNTAADNSVKTVPVIQQPSQSISSSLEKPKKVAAVSEPVQPLNPAEEQHIYQTAYDLIKAKKYNDAILTLQKMLRRYPSGQFAANAHYWLGELYGLINKNDKSADEFNVVVDKFPDSAKVADAQLKIGLIYMAEFKWPDAKDALKKVVVHFPGTASARLATEQLKQIRKAGH